MVSCLSSQGPSVLALTRQAIPQISKEIILLNLYTQGAYILVEILINRHIITIFATGSEVSIALATKEILQEKGFVIKIVSLLCFELFFKQDSTYIQSILANAGFKIAIEAGHPLRWHQIIRKNSLFFWDR